MEHSCGRPAGVTTGETFHETVYLDILRLQGDYSTMVDYKESIQGTTIFTPMQRNIINNACMHMFIEDATLSMFFQMASLVSDGHKRSYYGTALPSGMFTYTSHESVDAGILYHNYVLWVH